MSGIKPWVIGEVGVYVLGVEGVIDELTDETITIAGMTLPKRLSPECGIRYLSMTWPPDPGDCDREHCAGVCNEDSDDPVAEERVNDLERAIRSFHDDKHTDPFVFCPAEPCREVNR